MREMSFDFSRSRGSITVITKIFNQRRGAEGGRGWWWWCAVNYEEYRRTIGAQKPLRREVNRAASIRIDGWKSARSIVTRLSCARTCRTMKDEPQQEDISPSSLDINCPVFAESSLATWISATAMDGPRSRTQTRPSSTTGRVGIASD